MKIVGKAECITPARIRKKAGVSKDKIVLFAALIFGQKTFAQA
jgi:hypothetical protein